MSNLKTLQEVADFLKTKLEFMPTLRPAINALERLEQPQQEPYAWDVVSKDDVNFITTDRVYVKRGLTNHTISAKTLYDQPSNVRRLSDDELDELLEINYSDNNGSVNMTSYATEIMDACGIPKGDWR